MLSHIFFNSKTILNKMQVYLFSFLFVLSFYHTLFCHYSLRSQPLFITSLQFFQDLSNIFIHANRLFPYFFRCICFTLVQTHIKCMLKCVCHLPERIFYNTRSIISYTKFKEHYFLLFMILYKFLVLFCCLVPSLILNKCLIRSEIHTHRLATARAIWNQTRWNRKLYFSVFRFLQFPVFDLEALAQHHFFNGFFIVIGFLMARLTTLKQTIISLCVTSSPHL